MKNILTISAAGQELLYSAEDGTNRLFINGTEIASSSWVGTGTYTTTVEGHTVTITKASSLTGNLMLAETGSYAYEFRSFTETQPVTGVKGNSESAYRTGNVNLTAANIGAVDKTGDTMSGSLAVGDKRTIWDANSGTYISPNGFISARGSDTSTPGLYVTAYDSETTTYDAGFVYSSANGRWQANKQIYAPSFITTGNVTAERSDTSLPSVTARNSVGAVALHVAAAGNRGIYDSTDSEWIVYKNASTGQREPYATTSKSGFMSPADKTKLDGLSKPDGMDADGDSPSIASGTNWTNLMSTGVTLTANHKYLCTYRVQWASSSTGRRATRATIEGSDAGVISQCVCAAANGAATVMGSTFWIEPASSARTLNFQGYQNSNSARTATLRYQLIDFGT